MSLIEIIVGSLMFVIVATAVASALGPMLRAYSRAADYAEYNALLDNVANRIISDMSLSTASPDQAGSEIVIRINATEIRYTIGPNGVLLRKSSAGADEWSEVLPQGYYRNQVISELSVSPWPGVADAYMLRIEISSSRQGPTIEREYAVRPLVLNQK
jgi:hypothetical protein